MKRIFFSVCALLMAGAAQAQLAVGNWVKREMPQMTMVVEAMGTGYNITYHVPTADGKSATMTLKTTFDGSETEFLVDGKPTGQTYAGKRIDSRHVNGIVKMNGRMSATTKSELSADGNTITVENDSTSMGGSKQIEHWDRR